MPAAPAPSARPIWPVAAIVMAGAVTYANGLGHPFIFDDSSAIVDNPTIRALRTSALGGPFQLPTAGRPLVNVAFAVNYALGGVEPWGYHAVNLGLHVMCAVLLFALLRRLLQFQRVEPYVAGSETPIAAAVATIWVVHPLNSEIVNYAAQRTEVMMALAFLLTLYCGVQAIGSGRRSLWESLSVTACAAGMACKESMIVAPVMMLLVDATLDTGSIAKAVRRRPVYYAALFASWLVLAALVLEGPRWRSAGFSSGVSWWVYLINQAPVIARYLLLTFWPASLVLDYGEPAALTFAAVTPSFILVPLLVLCTIVCWFRAPLPALLGTWFFVTLAPTSSVIPIATEVAAERRMYLPVIAVLTMVVFAGRAAVQAIRPARLRDAAFAAGAAVVVCGLAVCTIHRNSEYASPLQIWQTSVDRFPTGRSHYNLGLELKAAGRRQEAIAQYEAAQATSADAHYAMGFELDEDGRHPQAITEYQAFIAMKPLDVNVPRAYHQIGRDLMLLGRRDEAIAAFREVLARSPHDIDALGGIADVQIAQEQWSDAVATYLEYLRVNPSNSSARFNLGLSLLHLSRFEDAVKVFADLVGAEPRNVAVRVNLGTALAALGRRAEAVRTLGQAAQLETDPDGRRSITALIDEIQSEVETPAK
jgi:tetratricopeptide (TPR) repeat protein